MRAIILAAGRGLRLQQSKDQQAPKCLLRFGDRSLLERHLLLLRRAGIHEIVLALGFRHEMVEAEIERLNWQRHPTVVLNEHYELGTMLTVHCVAEAMTAGGDVLLMDADVLYDARVLNPLIGDSRDGDRLLIDRHFEAGDEPVKVCLRAGKVVEFRKKVAADLIYDSVGESIGFYRYSASGARRLAELVAGYVDRGRSDLPHEEAIRDQLLERQQPFEVTDVTGAPWLEIDFVGDIARAEREVVPMLQPLD
jgi:choline kinase